MLKKLGLFFLVLGLFGCGSPLVDNRIKISDSQYDIVDYDAINKPMMSEVRLNVGVLLPLTGKASGIGLGMQNAMFMALDDLQNNRMILKFYDTQSSKSGAEHAANQAVTEGAQLILGPLMSDEVEGAASVALSSGVPVVSFTTSPQVLQKGVYSIGLLTGEQINESVAYAAAQGRKHLALLVPDNNSGLNAMKSALMSAVSQNISLTKVGFFNPESVDFSGLIKQMTSPVDFDAVLIADNGNGLKSLASMLAYNDVMYPDVLFLGTSAWDNTNLSRETILYHGVYPMVSKSYGTYFSDKYKDTFGEQPKSIYSFAYDSVLLASVLSGKEENVDSSLTGKNGFIGVNGFFKILPTGQSRHNLEMLEVTKDGPKVAAKSAGKTSDYVENEMDIRYIPYEKLPKIYGKNSSEVLRWLYDN